MEPDLLKEIPSLDLNDFVIGNADEKMNFVKKLGAAYSNIGFVAVKNHKLTTLQQKKLYKAVEDFFQLPDEVKQKYENEQIQGQRGYIGKMKEHAKGRSTGDLKEFYHIGQTIENKDQNIENYPNNIFPDEIPDLETYGIEAYQALERTGIYLLRAIALYLGLDEFYFDEKVKNGNSILRPIHYFPIDDPNSIPFDAVRAAEHTDINLITLLMGASADGLQVKRKDGKWIPITALPDQIVVNVGDMLSRLTNNKLRSTVHRVVNPEPEFLNEARFSIPFFMHPISSMDLSCLPTCVNQSNPKKFQDISAGEYLTKRLIEIGFSTTEK